MKKQKDYTITALLIVLLLAIFGSCTQKIKEVKHDYQLDISNDSSLTLYDGKRLVGTVHTNWQSALDTLILNDNQ